ncbi:ABC transporter substrate-binding protein [Cryptosporangium sp. NPDC048952]|uniref:ABC transporter substrate-binding protein n=1 Tax=Cryptosporangium sp. NPDC048952 TaxID=3363961 RepID=UPI003716860A
MNHNRAAFSFLLVAALLAGCSNETSPDASPSDSDLYDATIAATLPADVKSAGVIHVASGPGYPPILDVGEDGKTLSGSQPEEVRLIGQVLGLKIVFDDIKFDALFPALQSKKTDAAAAALGVTAERLQTVDFVTDYQGGTTLIVAGGNPEKLSLETVCGHSVGILKGSAEAEVVLPVWQKNCTDAGKPEMVISTFTTAADAVLATSSKRVDATISALPPAVYQAKQSNGALEALDINFDPSPWGIAFPKGSELAGPFQAALNKLIANGEYTKNLEKFGVQVGAVDKSEIYTSADQLPTK